MELTNDELSHLKSHARVNRSEIDSGGEVVVISEHVRRMQESLKLVFERQKLAGGIIDQQEIIVLTVRLKRNIFSVFSNIEN